MKLFCKTKCITWISVRRAMKRKLLSSSPCLEWMKWTPAKLMSLSLFLIDLIFFLLWFCMRRVAVSRLASTSVPLRFRNQKELSFMMKATFLPRSDTTRRRSKWAIVHSIFSFAHWNFINRHLPLEIRFVEIYLFIH